MANAAPTCWGGNRVRDVALGLDHLSDTRPEPFTHSCSFVPLRGRNVLPRAPHEHPAYTNVRERPNKWPGVPSQTGEKATGRVPVRGRKPGAKPRSRDATTYGIGHFSLDSLASSCMMVPAMWDLARQVGPHGQRDGGRMRRIAPRRRGRARPANTRRYKTNPRRVVGRTRCKARSPDKLRCIGDWYIRESTGQAKPRRPRRRGVREGFRREIEPRRAAATRL